MLDGYQPGDPMVRVFTYQATAGCRSPQEIADDAYEAFNADPEMLAGGQREIAARYRDRQLRSLSVGDVVTAGEAALAVARRGWNPVRGGLVEVRTDEHGTHPLDADIPVPEGGRHSPPAAGDDGDLHHPGQGAAG